MNPIDDGAAQIWSSLGKQVDAVSECFLLVGSQRAPPIDELVGDFDLPLYRHYYLSLIMSQDS